MEIKKKQKTDDVIMDKIHKVKVLEPVNTITQIHESHKIKSNYKGASIKTLKASSDFSD